MSGVKKINLRVHNRADGSKRLTFEVATTSQCVGEIVIGYDDVRYLPIFSELFAKWSAQMQPLVRRNGEHPSSILTG